ncbi:ROK family protein [Brevibacillus sp. AY1]|uniref:ROK family protein n=1 Tax=Brevibacillus sp. AY1 TaxID=2807621 RepID=UPI00245489F5|nr:ROK family protein [Brevibacillus sp. AY1]MDH4618936.1 ROK family protein [Brevibacillus sp. AY1]
MRHVIGLDVGGTTMKGAVMDETGRILDTAVRETGRVGSLEPLLIRMADLVGELRASSAVSIEAVGVGFPGPFDGKKGVSIHSPNLNLHQLDVRTPLATLIGLPLAMENDLRTAAWGEAVFGAGKGLRHLAFISIGTGIGLGSIVHGQLLRGGGGLSGELGHITVPGQTVVCNCGKQGCVETVASATGIVRIARERLTQAMHAIPDEAKMLPLWQRVSGDPQKITAWDVAEAAQLGDPIATAVWREVGEVTGWAISLVLNLFNPQLVVIGGGVSQAGEWLLAPVRESVRKHVMKAGQEKTRIVQSALGADAGMIGAGALALYSKNSLSIRS